MYWPMAANLKKHYDAIKKPWLWNRITMTAGKISVYYYLPADIWTRHSSWRNNYRTIYQKILKYITCWVKYMPNLIIKQKAGYGISRQFPAFVSDFGIIILMQQHSLKFPVV